MNKHNFFKQLTTSPKELERKCRKLLETYDYYNDKGDIESILTKMETLISKNVSH